MESHDVYENKAGYRREATMFMKTQLLSTAFHKYGNATLPHRLAVGEGSAQYVSVLLKRPT